MDQFRAMVDVRCIQHDAIHEVILVFLWERITSGFTPHALRAGSRLSNVQTHLGNHVCIWIWSWSQGSVPRDCRISISWSRFIVVMFIFIDLPCMFIINQGLVSPVLHSKSILNVSEIAVECLWECEVKPSPNGGALCYFSIRDQVPIFDLFGI